MVDNFKAEYVDLVKPIRSISKPFERFGLIFQPHYNYTGKYVYHWASLENELVIKIWKNGRMIIQNSLHKFFIGNNFTNFTRQEVKLAVEKIENILQLPATKFKIINLECAVNFTTELPFHLMFNSFKMNPFDNMRKDKTVFGKKCYLNDYTVKGYNKFLEVNLNPNSDELEKSIVPKFLKRFEVDFKRMRAFSGKTLYLSDLKSVNTFKLFGNKLVDCFLNVEMNKNYDYSILTPRERELFFAGRNSEFWKVEKMNMNTRKAKRRKYLSIEKKLDLSIINDPQVEIENLMKEKVNYLISN